MWFGHNYRPGHTAECAGKVRTPGVGITFRFIWCLGFYSTPGPSVVMHFSPVVDLRETGGVMSFSKSKLS
jgi:hypothetical protein